MLKLLRWSVNRSQYRPNISFEIWAIFSHLNGIHYLKWRHALLPNAKPCQCYPFPLQLSAYLITLTSRRERSLYPIFSLKMKGLV